MVTPFVATAEVKVAVLEAFVRAFMLSRTKTFRDISRLMPEGTYSSSRLHIYIMTYYVASQY